MIKLKTLIFETASSAQVCGLGIVDSHGVVHFKQLTDTEVGTKTHSQVGLPVSRDRFRYFDGTVGWTDTPSDPDVKIAVQDFLAKHNYPFKRHMGYFGDTIDENTSMIKLKELLDEAPIDVYQTIGDFSKGSSFTHKPDRMLITHPVAIQRVKNFFKNITEEIDFYFVNTKYARKYMELPRPVDDDFIFNDLKITPDQLVNGKINKDHITVFFTNNKGDERAPMTPWIIAHRFAHVVKNTYAFEEYSEWLNRKLDEILEAYGFKKERYVTYDRNHLLMKKHLCNMLGTFKSARDKNLRNSNEFSFECFAQYIAGGEVKINDLPDRIAMSYSYGRPQYRMVIDKEMRDDAIHELRVDFRYYIENVFTDCVGKTFVM